MVWLATLAVAVASLYGQEEKVDAIFARWTATTPGCTVGVATGGKTVLTKAYGMADLERNVPNKADSIFEAGSVSKQFTAAAVMLLARDGKLSIDDPVRKYIPELPDYKTPLTIRHMLNHTSGLRDWGNVAAIEGWPRGSRVHTHAHVLEIAGRQKALNFAPGTRWSYSNSGYNLAAILVARVSGMSFAEFTRKRIFEPLGMTRTSWRDDHTRVVKDRAIAYSPAPGGFGGFRTDMAFENVHGNGGLLTTVGDLLMWNENFEKHVVGDAAFAAEQQQPGRFNDKRAHGYAMGLFLETYKGLSEVSHGGATAGYRAFLARYPAQKVSVAVLCNAGNANPAQHAHSVADLYLAGHLKPPSPPVSTHTLTAKEIEAVEGLYRNKTTGVPGRIVREKDGVRVERGPLLAAQSGTRMSTANGQSWEFDGRGTVKVTDEYGTVDVWERVPPAKPTVAQLRQLAGKYASPEAEAAVTIAVEGESLVLKRRPDRTGKLTPIYADAFSGPGGLMIFRRDKAGRVTSFSIVQDRVWDLRFTRQP